MHQISKKEEAENHSFVLIDMQFPSHYPIVALLFRRVSNHRKRCCPVGMKNKVNKECFRNTFIYLRNPNGRTRNEYQY